jgi:hypothetical protein
MKQRMITIAQTKIEIDDKVECFMDDGEISMGKLIAVDSDAGAFVMMTATGPEAVSLDRMKYLHCVESNEYFPTARIFPIVAGLVAAAAAGGIAAIVNFAKDEVDSVYGW